ncbi:MAG: hypothetical protein K0Q51_240 [Rickettsiaceae bacterium]|jgi:hypothetical protein|nr:hypothetical protein [Rickettsiaceae bacterium]
MNIINLTTSKILFKQNIHSYLEFWRGWLIYSVLISLTIIATVSSASAFKISEVYIEAQGNNQYEAKIRAQKHGAVRAFLLYANRMGLPNDNFQEIKYRDIAGSGCITKVIYNNEKTTKTSYSAIAEYHFNRQISTEVFYKWSKPEYRNRFYDCLVVPVMKVGKNNHLWDNSIKWLKSWEDNKELLSENRVLLLDESNPYTDKVTPQNINNLTYSDFETLFPNFLIRNYYIIFAELFTNLDSGQSYLQVEYRNIGIKNAQSIIKKYNLPNANQLNLTLNEIINNFASEYGTRLENTDKNTIENIIAKERKRILQGKLKSIIINVETIDVAHWDRIRAKLDKVDQIEKIVIRSRHEHDYVLEIKYKENLEVLTQGLLEVGLTYNIAQNKYYLTESNDGI